jgi:hypothetical protein
VKVYSAILGVNILNSSLGTVNLHYNGSSPSGFTNSSYKGMTTSCSAFVGNSSSSNSTTNSTSNTTQNSTSNTTTGNTTSNTTT